MAIYNLRTKNRKHIFNWLTVVLLVIIFALASYILYTKKEALHEAKSMVGKAWTSLKYQMDMIYINNKWQCWSFGHDPNIKR